MKLFGIEFRILNRPNGPPLPPTGPDHYPSFMTNPHIPPDPLRMVHVEFLFFDGSKWDVHHHFGGCKFIGTTYLFFDRDGQLALEVPNTGGIKSVRVLNAKEDPQKTYIPAPRAPRPRV